MIAIDFDFEEQTDYTAIHVMIANGAGHQVVTSLQLSDKDISILIQKGLEYLTAKAIEWEEQNNQS